MTDTLIDAGEQPQVADANTEQASQAADTSAQPAGQNQTETDTQAGATEGNGETGKGEPQGAPEAYEFAAPEGQQFDPAVIDAFSDVARELNLSQDAAQKVLDKVAPVLHSRQLEQIEAVKTDWANQTRGDTELGGAKLDENLATAKRALDQYGTPELKNMLNETGLGNQPEVIRLFYRVGKTLSQDSFVGGVATDSKSAADILYDKSTK